MIYKRGDTYYYEFVLRGRRYRESTQQKNPRTARQLEAARKTGILKGEVGIKDKTQSPKFSDYADQWIETYAKAHCKYSTLKSYEGVLAKHLKPAFSGKLLDEITRQDIADLINRKLASTSHRKKPTSRGTVRNILAPLREMLNHATDSGILLANPANRAGRYMKEKKAAKSNRMKLDALTREEVQKVLDAAESVGAETRTVILTAVRTGVRMGELFGLQWEDLDFNSRFLEIRRNITRGRIETPKSGQLRRVDMSKQLSDALQELRRRRKMLYFNVRSEAEKLRNTGTDEAEIPKVVGRQLNRSAQFVRSVLQVDGEIPAWVFINEEGEPHEQNNFRKRVFTGLLTKAESVRYVSMTFGTRSLPCSYSKANP